MSKIDTKSVRNKAVDMMNDLKGIVGLYMDCDREKAAIESNTTFARAYKDGQLAAVNEKMAAAVKTKFESLQSNYEGLIEVMRINDNIYDFSAPEFGACVALISAADKALPYETVLGIAGKFLGNRQALLALTEVAKDANKDVFKRMVFNTETEAEKLQSRIIELEINFPKSILMVPAFRDDVIRIAAACGEDLTETEKDLGAGYQDIVMMQTRAAMGLPN